MIRAATLPGLLVALLMIAADRGGSIDHVARHVVLAWRPQAVVNSKTT